jgi:hypothetical protein
LNYLLLGGEVKKGCFWQSCLNNVEFRRVVMKFKPLAIGLPLIAGLAFVVSACESPETEIETPSGETEIEQPSEAPIESPGVSPAPVSPSPTSP